MVRNDDLNCIKIKNSSCFTSSLNHRFRYLSHVRELVLTYTRGVATTDMHDLGLPDGRGQLRCDGTRAETRFPLSAKRTSPFKSAGGVSSVDYWQPEVCASAVVMLDTPCSGIVWRVLATHSIRQFPLHFPSRASPCAITFQLESTKVLEERANSFFKVTKFQLESNMLSSMAVGRWRFTDSCSSWHTF